MSRDRPGVLDQVSKLIQTQMAGACSDAELLDRFTQSKDAVAFETLMRRHGPLVFRVCRRVLAQEQDAEDVFQATFLLLSRKAASLRNKGAVGPWLVGVASRLALKARLALRRRAAHEAALAARALHASRPEPSVSEAEALLEEELARLPEKYRSVLVLCYAQGLTRGEAARQLGLTPANIKKRAERGRALLQHRLARRGVTLSSALLGTLLAGDALAALPPSLVAATVNGAVAVAAGQSLAGAGLPAAVVALVRQASAPLVAMKVPLLAAVALGLAATGIASALVLDGWESPAARAPVATPRAVKEFRESGQVVPPSTPFGLPLAVRLVGKTTTFSLDLHGLTPEQYREKVRPGPDGPPIAAVDLQLRVTNYGRKELKFRVRGPGNRLSLDLKGPGAITIPRVRASARPEGVLPGKAGLPPAEEVTLAPGQTATLLDVSSLAFSGAGPFQEKAAYWTKPGKYTLSAEYKVWISPVPVGSTDAGDGFGDAVLRTPKLRLNVETPE